MSMTPSAGRQPDIREVYSADLRGTSGKTGENLDAASPEGLRRHGI
jgi:hypothetical protein